MLINDLVNQVTEIRLIIQKTLSSIFGPEKQAVKTKAFRGFQHLKPSPEK
jgi:hypothetical protein